MNPMGSKTPEEEFLQQVAESKNNAAQVSALDLLSRAATLNNQIMDLVDDCGLQPVLIVGVLETVKGVVQKRAWDAIPKRRE